MIRHVTQVFFLLLFIGISPLVNSQITWQKDASLNAGMPKGVEVFRGTGTTNGTSLIKAIYTSFDQGLNPQVELDVTAANNVLRTPQQFAAVEKEKVYATINGGFFGGTASNSLTIKNGVVVYPNLKSISRNGVAYYPTRAAFGITANGIATAEWMYNVGTPNTPYRYPAPSPNNVTQAPQVQPTAAFPTGGNVWNAYTAIGAGPLLLKNGIKNINDTAELFDAASGVNPGGREPRTAIGATATGKYILLVVDGRSAQSSGATMNELADIFLSLGCVEAINLDGGGSSSMFVNGSTANVPSDAAGVRPVSSVVMIKQKNWIYDTEFGNQFSEIGGAWTETSNAGFFGPSKARFTNSGDGSRKAFYILTDLPPARYSLSAWWVAAGNRSNRTPYIIKRRGYPSDTVFVNQTINGAAWNTLGSYQLSASDTIEVSSNGQPGALVTIDAIQLVKTGEANPMIRLGASATGEHIKDSTIRFRLRINSINTGVQFDSLVVTKLSPNGSRQRLDKQNYSKADSIDYFFTQVVNETIGSQVAITFEASSSIGQVYDTIYKYRVSPVTQVRLLNNNLKEAEKGKLLEIATVLETLSTSTTLRNLRVYKTMNGTNRILVDSLTNIGGLTKNYNYQELITLPVTTTLTYDFELIDSQNDTAMRTVITTVVPGRGNYRMVVISDLNSSFGATTYEWQVDSIMQRIPRLWKPDMVVAGGDLVAGQSNTAYDSAGNARMWTAFDQKIMKPLRDNQIPLAFTMGNHDAATGFSIDRVGARNYWMAPGNFPNVLPIDTSHYPYYHSFMDKQGGDFFFVNWEASDANFSQADIDWTKAQFLKPEAQQAKYRILIGHMPFYGVAQERDGAGNILNNGDDLRKMADDLGVTLYVSGHHHAYFPGKRGNIELLNAGAAGSGPRKWVFGDETAPNTVTVIDFFTATDSLVYTTYEIDSPEAADMKVFEESRLPKAIFGVNGFTRNRNVIISGTASGILSPYHATDSVAKTGAGQVQFTPSGNTILVTGSFSNLTGSLLKTPDAIGVYKGLFPQQGELIKGLTVKTSDGKNGTFEGVLPIDIRSELLELVSVGAIYINVKTTAFINGELRAQLYAANNQPLLPAIINTQLPDSVYQIRNSPAYFKISWSKATDSDRDAALYNYELAEDSLFINPIYTRYNATDFSLGLSQQQLWQLLDTVPVGIEKMYYHRVIASDGKFATKTAALRLRLIKTDAPASGNIELQAPAYVYQCAAKDGDGNCTTAFANSASGHGAVVDKFGKVWYHPYSGGVSVKNGDGSFYQLTSTNIKFSLPSAPNTLLAGWQPGAYLRQVTLNGTSYTINLVTGIGSALDGNILVAAASALIKLDAFTGEPMRYVQLGSLGLSNPTSDSLGRIFLTRVLNNQSFILKESTERPFGYDTIRSQFSLDPYPGTTRASAMAYDGKSVYLPSAGGNFVNRYVAADGLNFVFDRRINLQGTCNAIHVKPGNRVYILSNKAGNVSPIVEYRDFSDTTQIQSWSFPLNDITAEAGDIRALAMNQAADTFYAASLGSFKLYKYHLPAAGNTGNTKPSNAPLYFIKQVKNVHAQSGIADSLGVYCQLTGIVQSVNDFAASNGYAFTLQDTTGGIRVFELAPTPYVTVSKGDTIQLRGFIRQSFGQLLMVPDTLVVLGNNRTLNMPLSIDSLNEKNESSTVQLSPLTLKRSGQWATTNAHWLNDVWAQKNGGDSILLQVPAASNILNWPAPRGEFMVTGIGGQFAEIQPYNYGYHVVVRDNHDVAYTNTTITTGSSYCSTDSMLINVAAYGKFGSANQFTIEVSDSTGSFANLAYQLKLPIGATQLKIPVPAEAASGYRVRATSSQPALLGGDYVEDITVLPTLLINISQTGNQLTASGAETYQWYYNNTPVPAPQGQQAVLTITQNGFYQVMGSKEQCSSLSALLPVFDPLSVTILSITAIRQLQGILVSWKTTFEKDMRYYEIEYSADGIQFTPVAKLAALPGTTNSYSWLDDRVKGNENHYRIKAVDKDGKVQYSGIVALKGTGKGKLVIYPNPVIDEVLTFQMANLEKGQYSLRLYNTTGKQIHFQQVYYNGGNTIYRINLTTLPSGIYHLVLQGAKEKVSESFSKK